MDWFQFARYVEQTSQQSPAQATSPESLQNAAEIASLWLTFPTIILGLGVVIHWGPHVYRKALGSEEWSAHDWLVMGVFFGFLGAVGDNAWWGIAWSFDYLTGPGAYRDWWFRHGAICNIFARQLCGSYAAYCHMVAFYQAKQNRKVNHWVLVGLCAGALYAIALGILKKLFG